MLLHAAHAGLWDAVTLGRSLEEDDEVWVSFGVGKVIRFLAAHEMARALGPAKAQPCPCFMFLQGVTRSPASPDMARGQNGQRGQLYLRSHKPSLTSLLHQLK